MMTNAWRTIIAEPHESFGIRDNQLLIQNEDSEITIPLEQIRELLLTSNQGKISLPLITRLASQNTSVIFCDAKRSPVGELSGINIHSEAAGRLMDQAGWTLRRKQAVWKQIVRMKISRQIDLLKISGQVVPIEMERYRKEVQTDDATNREALAAKLYFSQIFGKDFYRSAEDTVNAALNYGYTILCSAFNRMITLHGYNTALGIHHCNRYNSYNLSCDLMEPFRPFVDRIVLEKQNDEFDQEYRKRLVAVLYDKCKYDGKDTTVENAIEMFILDFVKVMENPRMHVKEVKFVESS